MQASTPLLLRHASITSTSDVAARAAGHVPAQADRSTGMPSSAHPTDFTTLQGVRNRRAPDFQAGSGTRYGSDAVSPYRHFDDHLDALVDTQEDVTRAGYESDADALDAIFARHTAERNGRGKFSQLRAGFSRAARFVGSHPAPLNQHVPPGPVTLLQYRPRSDSAISMPAQSDVGATNANANTVTIEPLSPAANSLRGSSASGTISDHSDFWSESDADTASDSDDASLLDSTHQSDSPMEAASHAEHSQGSALLTAGAQSRNQAVIQRIAEHTAEGGEAPAVRFQLNAQRDFFMALLTPKNHALVTRHTESDFDRGFHYLMPTLCALADDFGVDREAIAEQANHFANFAFRPEGDTLLGISKPDLRNSIERKLHLPKARAARRTPDHLHAVKSLMRLIDKELTSRRIDSAPVAPSEPADDRMHPLAALTDRLTWALMLTQHGFVSALATQEHLAEADRSPFDASNLSALHMQYRDVTQLVPFSANSRRSIISVMQQRMKLIHNTMGKADSHVSQDDPLDNPQQQDATEPFDQARPARVRPAAGSPVSPHAQYRIPGWGFLDDGIRHARMVNVEEDTVDAVSVHSASDSSGHDTDAIDDIDSMVDADVRRGHALSDRLRARQHRTREEDAVSDVGIRL